MALRELRAETPLETLEDEIVYTDAALKADPEAEDLAPGFAGQLESLDEVYDRERATRRAVTEATAYSRVADSRLDEEVLGSGRVMEVPLKGDRTHPSWTKVYGTATPSDVAKLARPKEVIKVRGMIKAMTELGLAILATVIASLTFWAGRLDGGLTRLTDSKADRGRFRSERDEFIIGLNRARRALYGSLTTRAAERGLPKEWPDLFFRHETSRTRSKPTEEPPPA
jgi:hypothetical protein